MSIWFGSQLDWAMDVIMRHAKQSPKEDSKECWKLQLANQELHAIQQILSNDGTFSLFRLATVNYSHHNKNDHHLALYNESINRQNYAVAAGALRRLHPFLTSFIWDLTDNTYDAAKYHKREMSDVETALCAVQGREDLLGVVCKMIMSQLQRLQSEHNPPFLL